MQALPKSFLEVTIDPTLPNLIALSKFFLNNDVFSSLETLLLGFLCVFPALLHYKSLFCFLFSPPNTLHYDPLLVHFIGTVDGNSLVSSVYAAFIW